MSVCNGTKPDFRKVGGFDKVVEVVLGFETKDPKTGFTYVKISKGWITKSALG